MDNVSSISEVARQGNLGGVTNGSETRYAVLDDPKGKISLEILSVSEPSFYPLRGINYFIYFIL